MIIGNNGYFNSSFWEGLAKPDAAIDFIFANTFFNYRINLQKKLFLYY